MLLTDRFAEINRFVSFRVCLSIRFARDPVSYYAIFKEWLILSLSAA
jgi:hypothetical protein